MNILILNGPNLNLLSKREPKIYGSQTFEEILQELHLEFPNFQITYFQSNFEGEIIDKIQRYEEFDGIIINAGAFSHYSYAIYDALLLADIPKIEVHFSNIYARESFRNQSVLSKACNGVICGLGKYSYYLALEWFRYQCKSNQFKS